MTSSLEPESAGLGGRLNSLRFCEHCDMLGVSSVISSDLETNDIVYCAICSLQFHFVTEGNRIIVTKVESIQKQRNR